MSLQNFDFKRDVSHITVKSCRYFVCWISASKLLAMPRIMPTGLLVSNSAHKLFNTSKAQTFQLKGKRRKTHIWPEGFRFLLILTHHNKNRSSGRISSTLPGGKTDFLKKFSFPYLWWRICDCLTNSRSETHNAMLVLALVNELMTDRQHLKNTNTWYVLLCYFLHLRPWSTYRVERET